MLRRRQRERIFENMIRFGKAFLNIAAVELEVGADIGAFDRLDLGKIGKTGSRHLTESCTKVAPGLQRLVNIQNRRQLFIVDFDQAQRFFRRIDGQGRNRCHRIADMAHFLHGDDRLIFEHRTVVRLDAFVVQNIVARQYRHDAGNFQRLGSIDALDARMRHTGCAEFCRDTSPGRSCRPRYCALPVTLVS